MTAAFPRPGRIAHLRILAAAVLLLPVVFATGEAGATTYLTDSFESGGFPPTGWQVEQIANGATVSVVTTSSWPADYTAFNGTRFIRFNSYSYNSGVARLRRSSPGSTVGFTNLVVSFVWLESSGYASLNDRVEVEWSTNGTAWNSAAVFPRYNPLQGWKVKSVTLPADSLGQPSLYIGFKFTSAYGNDCYLDYVRISDSLPRSPTGTINYQGRISMAGTNYDGIGRFWFSLLNSSGGTAWSSGDSGVQVAVTKGLYSVMLGDTTVPGMDPFPDELFATSDLRLRVLFDGGNGAQLMSPDQWVGSAGYALMAARANAAGLIGTIPDVRLSTNVALLAGSPTFSGTVNASQFVGNGAGLTNLATAGLADNSITAVKLASDSASLYKVSGGHMAWNGGQVNVEAQMRLNRNDLFLREGTDLYHGLGWYGASKEFGGVNVDGPVAYGYSGGGLGTSSGTNQLALRWTAMSKVIIDPHGFNSGNIASNSLTFGLNSGEGIASRRIAGPNAFGLDFYTVYMPRLSIDNVGRVGIGTQTPTNALDVVGSISADAIAAHGTNAFQVKVNNLQRLRLDTDGNVVAGGTGNVVKPGVNNGAVGGGSGHTLYAASDYATIAGGEHNTISNAPYAAIPGGSRAVARHQGQMAFAGGSLVSDGDAQTCVYVLRNKSLGTSQYSLYLDGASETKLLTVPAGARWVFDILVIASNPSGTTGGWQIRGIIKNTAGSTSFVGTPTVTALGSDAAWSAGVEADNANDALRINVTGSGAVEWVSWVATVRTVEVTPQ